MKLSILDIKNPLLLFNKKKLIKLTYRELMMEYHPDRHPGKEAWANEMTMHISELYNKMEEIEKLCHDDFVTTVNLLMRIPRGPYREYIFKDKVIYNFTNFRDGITEILKHGWNSVVEFPLKYNNEEMEKEFSRFLPKTLVISGSSVIINHRPPNTVPLDMLLKHFKGRIEPKTVAWMVSRMLNLACMFYVHDLTYLGFIAKYLYVDPYDHQIYPYGGWWSVSKYGKPSLITKEVVDALPFLKNKKKEIPRNADVSLIKHTALKLLGDPMRKTCPADIPDALREWLFSSVGDTDPIACYKEWYQVLADSWGKRQFTPCNVNVKMLFNV